jgi:hypothetical protein
MNRLIPALGAVALGASLAVAIPSPSSAHIPAATATCDGVQIRATDYEAGRENEWHVTLDTAARTFVTGDYFGAGLDMVIPVDQGGAVTSWSVRIEGYDGEYVGDFSGTVGPCGEPEPEVVRIAYPRGLVTEPTCEAAGTVILTPGDGYTWGPIVDGEATATTIDDRTLFPNGLRTYTATGLVAEPILPQEVCNPKPEPIREFTEWVGGPDCETGVYTETRTRTRTDWVLVDDVWVLGEPVQVVQTRTHDVQPGDCPEPVVEPDPEPTDEPTDEPEGEIGDPTPEETIAESETEPVVETDEAATPEETPNLPNTGASADYRQGMILGGTAAAIGLLALLALAVTRRRRV